MTEIELAERKIIITRGVEGEMNSQRDRLTYSWEIVNRYGRALSYSGVSGTQGEIEGFVR
jgi:hypothetical protein